MDKGDRKRGGDCEGQRRQNAHGQKATERWGAKEVVKRGCRQEEEGELEWGKRSRQGLVEPKAPRREIDIYIYPSFALVKLIFNTFLASSCK